MTDSRNVYIQRCNVVCDATGMPRASGAAFVRHVLDRYNVRDPWGSGEAAGPSISYLLFAAFLGRVPRECEVAPLLLACKRGDCEEVARFFFALPEFKAAETRGRTLTVPPSDALVVDVTHTMGYRHTSGIQRVVRSLCDALCSRGTTPTFVRYCRDSQSFLPLSATELRSLICPRPSSPRKRLFSQATSHRIKNAKAYFKRSVPEPVARCASNAVRGLKWFTKACIRTCQRLDFEWKRLSSRAATWSHDKESVFVWNHTVLLPELVADPHHIDALTLVLTSSATRSTLIVYDVLPIQRPEWFPPSLVGKYVAYLTLLRHVDAISCISAVVHDDLMKLMPLICRSKPAPIIAHHYLGADFAAGSKSNHLVTSRTSPVVLCVGTIEPRKNQARILEAMTRAQERGCRFTGVFVGNAGWLNGHFRKCLQDAIRRGCDIRLHEHASDADLAALYRASAFTIYCSLAEGFGLPVIESVMRRKPCITSDRGSMKEIGEQIGGCVFVDPESVDDIAGAIQRLLEDAETFARVASAATLATWTTWQEYGTAIRSFAERARHETSFGRTPGNTTFDSDGYLKRTA